MLTRFCQHPASDSLIRLPTYLARKNSSTTILKVTINLRLFHHQLLPRRLRIIDLPRMPRRVIIRVPLGSQITPPRRRASVAAFLLEFPIRGRAVDAVLGYLPGRHLWVSGSVVEGSMAVVAWTRRYAAHLGRIS